MSETATGKDAAGFCADLVRTHDFVRYASTLFVPTDQRRALLALYAFNVEISRIRIHVSQALSGEVRLQWWTDMLAGTAHGGIEGNPVAAELLLTIRNAGLPAERLSRSPHGSPVRCPTRSSTWRAMPGSPRASRR
jgi:phytoene synthase